MEEKEDYYNVWADRAINKDQAYKLSVEDMGFDTEEGRYDFDGISYTGSYGEVFYIDFDDLPETRE